MAARSETGLRLSPLSGDAESYDEAVGGPLTGLGTNAPMLIMGGNATRGVVFTVISKLSSSVRFHGRYPHSL